MRAGEERALDAVIDDTIRQLDTMRAGARSLRNDTRAAALDRLRGLDEALIDSARRVSGEAALQQLGVEADAELAPFRARLADDAYARARNACIGRLLRDRYRLPVVTLE
jgi:hypothetical protein